MSRIRGIELQKEVSQKLVLRKNCNFETNNNKEICSKDEQEKKQIKDLLLKLPKLNKIFEVHRKIGEGTFSSVYLGTLRQHAQLPEPERRLFAIKHLVPTAHPARIEHELRCLRDIGGKENVIGVELCLRHLDTIVFIMPYIQHRKFTDYVGDMDAEEVRQYMKALLVALRHVHSFGIIHRDVKPSNFLYDRENRRYLLVDFGLSQCVVGADEPPPAHAASAAKRAREEECEALQDAKRIALDLTTVNRDAAALEAVEKTLEVYKPFFKTEMTSGSVSGAGEASVRRAAGRCACAGAGGVCAACAARPAARAPRAGTQGFRPPEVLLKVRKQGVGVDVWAVGVVMASALTARYPLLRAADDAGALAELADLLGTERLQHAAAALGRRIVVSASRRGLCLRKLAARLRAAPSPSGAPAPSGTPEPPCASCRLPRPQCLCREDRPADHIEPGAETAGFPDSAFALAARLLDPDPRTRPSAAQALQHPFLRDTAGARRPPPRQ